MGKLKKPKKINEILSKGIVLRSRNAYSEVTQWKKLQYKCTIRSKWHLTLPYYVERKGPYSFEQVPCCDIRRGCPTCFLNANNYLNVLKYMKQNNINN